MGPDACHMKGHTLDSPVGKQVKSRWWDLTINRYLAIRLRLFKNKGDLLDGENVYRKTYGAICGYD